MNRITEWLCIATLTLSFALLFSTLAERLKPAPDTARIEGKLDAIMVERGLALTPCETPIPIVPEEIQ